MLSENLQRKDLSEVEKAEAIHEMYSGNTGMSLRQIAKKIGINHMYLYNLLQLHGYPTEVKDMVKSEEVSAKSVRPLSQLQTPQEQIKVAEHIKDHGLNYTQAKDVVDKIKDSPPEVRSALTDDPDATVDCVIAEIYDDTEETPLSRKIPLSPKLGRA